jgi:CRISPR-associated endonuclease/helicase Cas3
MSSKSFREILSELDKGNIPPKEYYSAHKRRDKLEWLEDHAQLCEDYFLHIIEKLGLEDILDKLIISIFGRNRTTEIKELIGYAVFYHDIGKLNPYFQKIKTSDKKAKADTRHSVFSENIFISLFLDKYPKSHDILYILTYILRTHHGKLPDFKTVNYGKGSNEKDILNKILKKISSHKMELSEQDKANVFYQNYNWKKVFIFIKLVYALLVMSDAYSTMHFSYNLDGFYPLKTLNRGMIKKMRTSFFMVPYNSGIDEMELSKDLSSLNSINEIRKQILIESNTTIKKLLNENHHIFMLPVPTGGGKTNVSMKLALDIFEFDRNLNRIFYVFPYINIIEQNHETIKNTLFNTSLFENQTDFISDIYSKAYLDKVPAGKVVDTPVEKKEIILNDNFLNNCVNTITNVNFFNAFIKNTGNNRYKIINLCNSIVIIDEVQTLSDSNLRVFYDIIRETSETLNMYYIIMSATLPDLNNFLDDANIPIIIKNSKKYFVHPVFSRNQIIFRTDLEDIESIKTILKEEIEKNYNEGKVKILVTLNTVNTSRKVFESLKEDNDFNEFEFYLLNSTIPSLRRRKIIEELKDVKKNHRVIIVSTQSIEAGMDIDCDFGIRDYSILDSIEQISGRINRECDPVQSRVAKLFVVNFKDKGKPDCNKVYGNQPRYKVQRKYLGKDKCKKILEYKDFGQFYEALSEEVKKLGRDAFTYYQGGIHNLHFQKINDEFDVIDNAIDKIDIYVRERLSLSKISTNDKMQISNILKDKEILKVPEANEVITANVVDTESIYLLWKYIMQSTDRFEDIYIRKKITSLMNQFIISITNLRSSGNNNNLKDYLLTEGLIEKDEDLNIFLSKENFSDYYLFENGINTIEMKRKMGQTGSGIFL